MNKQDNKEYTIYESIDKTILIKFKEGYSCVIIPSKNNKITLCLSSQIGCPIGCTFCHTKQFIRNLTYNELINQIETSKKIIENKKITSIVFMGMGEPMLNLENVIKTINYANKILNISYKHITLSTIGINLEKLKHKKFNIAISLHNPFEEQRKKIIPNSIKITSILEHVKELSNQNKNGVMISYTLIKSLNDSKKHLDKLLSYDWPKNTNFNIIEFNNKNNLEKSEKSKLELFKNEIIKKGYKCFIREKRGYDISAACGMLNYE
jgi:23S rRNA (adenine2503-C2)-methyltransferase